MAQAASITIQPQGQVLTVDLTAPGSAVEAFYSDAALTSSVTLPYRVATDTTLYTGNFGPYTLSVKQVDGTELRGDVVSLTPSTPLVFAPQPSSIQVAADLGAAGARWRSGDYYYVSNGVVQSSGTITVDSLLLVPGIVPNDCTITRIGGYVSGAGGAGSVIRFGVYNTSADGGIGSLVADFGTIDGTSATVQEITISQALTKGLYWFGAVAQVGTTPSMDRDTTSANNIPFPYRTSIPTTTFKPVCVVQTGVTGALTSTLASPAASGSFPPRIFVKVS